MPQRERLMVFVDGTNFLIQLAKEFNFQYRAEKPPWAAISLAASFLQELTNLQNLNIIRRYWFASYKGSEEFLYEYKSQLRRRNFDPKLFRKRDGREKGVDIALTKEMLVNAFQQNCDLVILIAGDEDYVELVEEVKRYGQKIWGAFFQNGLSKNLQLSLDAFFSIGSIGFGTSFQSLCDAIRAETGTAKSA